MISDTQDMLDNLYDEYSDLISKKLDDFSGLVKEGLKTSNDNTATISSYLETVAKDNGYTQETKDLFNGVATSISASVKELVSEIKAEEKSNSDTNSDTNSTSDDKTTTNKTDIKQNKADETAKIESAKATVKKEIETSKAKTLTANAIAIAKTKNQSKKSKVENIFAKTEYFNTAKKKKASDYQTKINQYLFKKDGKVLSSSGLAALRSALGVSKNSELYDAMVALKKSVGDISNVKGFKTGGIAQLVRSKGEDGIAMVRNGEGLIAPENVSDIQELLKSVPIMNDLTNSLIKLPDYSSLASVNNIGSTTVGDMVFNIDMNNVTNAEEIINAIQTDQKVQKALRSVTTDRIAGGTRLGVNKIK
jgi:hypothetical protein